MIPSRDIQRLLDIMAALRDAENGCPWDKEQNFASIAPYTVEEACEVADAIARDDLLDLCEELGDLLLQVAYHAQMAEEIDAFDFGDVVEAITRKMIRRHPHVFGDEGARSAGAAKGFWERIKAEEKRERAAQRTGQPEPPSSLLDGIGAGQAGLARAVKLQAKASTVGFDWNDPRAVLRKLREETDEITEVLDGAEVERDRAEDEIGDLLFTVANLARHLQIDPDQALRRTNAKFVRRFNHIETAISAMGSSFEKTSLDEMETLWQRAKSGEKATSE